jgi:tRNA (guanine-N7-)-methyltransferase
LRSFVRREGRFTPSQRRAVAELLPRYALPDGDAPLDLRAVFGRDAPCTLEIGFGNGAVLATLAAAEPQHDFIGIEVYRPGVGRLLSEVARHALGNLRVSEKDAVQLLRGRFADASLARIMVFFPDPWPKKRQQKRRLIQPPFAALLASKLEPGGQLCLATDWQDYATQMLAVMEGTAGMRNHHGAGNYAPRPDYRPITRFEQRGQRLGHGVWDLVYDRCTGVKV